MYATELNCGTRFAGVMRSCAAHGTEPVTVVACGNTTPLGTPVVPDVNITYPGVVGLGCGGGHGGADDGTSSRNSSGAPPDAVCAMSRCAWSVSTRVARLARSMPIIRSTGSRASKGVAII